MADPLFPLASTSLLFVRPLRCPRLAGTMSLVAFATSPTCFNFIPTCFGSIPSCFHRTSHLDWLVLLDDFLLIWAKLWHGFRPLQNPESSFRPHRLCHRLLGRCWCLSQFQHLMSSGRFTVSLAKPEPSPRSTESLTLDPSFISLSCHFVLGSWDSCPKTRFCSRQPWETQSCPWIIYRDLCDVVLYEVLLCIYIFVALVFSIVCSQTCYDLIESFLKIEESLLVCSAVFH